MIKPYTILIVEDDPFQRMHAWDVLTDAGYTVLEASGTKSALRILEARNDIDVLLTDVEMPPGADGIELAGKVHEFWPHILLLVVSGRPGLRPEDVPDGNFIAKPFSDREILAGLGSLIEGHGGGGRE